jgi:glycerol-3-phosphate dehydrogenase (NAD(P)+)
MTNLTVVGATTWGTTLAIISAREGSETKILVRSQKEATYLNSQRENTRFLPGVKIPETAIATESLDNAFDKSEVILFAVPSHSLRQNAKTVANKIDPEAIVVSAVKGLEVGSGKRMSEILAEELPNTDKRNICALSGPNLAMEIVKGKPSSTVIASSNIEVCTKAQKLLNSKQLRIYTNDDIIGVEIGGALKNITAIAVGISDGLQFGDNAKAAIITRGLAEIARLGESLGAKKSTFSGLAGMGDLIATCSSSLSRNNQVGRMLATGQSIQDIHKTMKNVAEGVKTTEAAISISRATGISMPIASSVYDVLFNGIEPTHAVSSLMERAPTSEN